MSYLEELLPEFRKGAKIRLPLWDKGQYLRYDTKTKNIVNDKGEDTDIMGCHLSSDQWEFYKGSIDWDSIIKNKCLCWFWDNMSKIKYLRCIQSKEDYDFRDELGVCWKYCRPVRRNEVTFYEDNMKD